MMAYIVLSFQVGILVGIGIAWAISARIINRIKRG